MFENRFVSTGWKLDNRIYIKKTGKESYHTPKSCRGISLTSVSANCMSTLELVDCIAGCNSWNSSILSRQLTGKIRTYPNLSFISPCHAWMVLRKTSQQCRSGGRVGLMVNGERGSSTNLSKPTLLDVCLVYSFLSGRISRNLVNNFESPWTSTKLEYPKEV